jgi:glycosyltransferase involved in cell wall biosynthesis
LKPNVLQLVGSFHQGGSEHQAIQLTQLLRASDRYHIHLACLSPEGALRQQVEETGLKDIPSFPLSSFYDYNAVKQLTRFRNFVRAHSIDIVQTHDFYTNIFGMTASTAARVGVRIAAKRETAGMRTGAQLKAEKLAFKLSHAVVANSEAVKTALLKDGVDQQKIATIYNSLDLSRLTTRSDFDRDEALSRLALPQGKKLVTIVANLRHAVKDHPTFLRAAGLVRREVADAAFVLAGEGELTESMQKLAGELGIAGDVFFVGRCERVNELLALSDVCVLSSVAEGFSNAILEYMGAGRPVVATDVGGAREAIREGVTGFIVPPQDPEAMAKRIVELLKNPVRAVAMGQAGRRVVEDQFSCAAQLRRTEELYERLLSATRTELARRPRKVHSESL